MGQIPQLPAKSLRCPKAPELRRGQPQPHDDLATVIKLAGRREPEPLVERGGPAVPRDEAGQQFGRAFGPHQFCDLPDDRRAVVAVSRG
jgi:hypothetical protein